MWSADVLTLQLVVCRLPAKTLLTLTAQRPRENLAVLEALSC